MRALSAGVIALMFFAMVTFPGAAVAKKGGVGKGGGQSEDGIFYHSHSNRSYSGKEHFKGQGKALGRDKGKHTPTSGKKVKTKGPRSSKSKGAKGAKNKK